MIVTELLIFTCAFFIARFFWIHRRYYYLVLKIPFSGFDTSLRGIYDYLTADTVKMFRLINGSLYNKSDVAKTWLGPMVFVVLNNADDVKFVMNSRTCYDKPYFIKFPKLYKGSVFGDVEFWRSHKKIMNPFFGTQGMRSFIPIFNEKTKIFINSVSKMAGKGEFNVFHSMTALTLETILKVMDYDVDIQNKEEKSRDIFIKNLEIYSKVSSLRMLKFWQHPEMIFKRSKFHRIQNEAMSNSAMSFADDILANVRNNMNNNDMEKPNTLMEAFLSPKNNLTDDEVRDEVNTVIIAAQDTSAIASSSTLLLLAMFKDVQQKVVDELYTVFGKTKDTPYIDYDQLNELVYLEMVVNEVMRLLPVVPFVAREVDEEFTTVDGYTIPVKASIAIPIIRLHRNKKYWGEDADEFKPERFEKERFQKIHPYAYVPFTKGARMCIGHKYAIFLMKIQLANFLMRYKIDTSLKYDELQFGVQITMTVNQGYRISIQERNCKVD